MDKELLIRARQADENLVMKVGNDAADEFEKNAGFAIEIGIDDESPLPPDRSHLSCQD